MIDFPEITRRTAHQLWDISPEKKEESYKAFTNYAGRNIASIVGEYKIISFSLMKGAIERVEKLVPVKMVISDRGDIDTYEVNFEFNFSEKGWRVCDISVGGFIISGISNFRSQFAQTKKHGWSFEKLLEDWRKKGFQPTKEER